MVLQDRGSTAITMDTTPPSVLSRCGMTCGGNKGLFVNGFTTHFTNFHTPANVRVGQDYQPGAAALLAYLVSQAFIPEYQVRWRWAPGSVAFWDNRCTQHYAVMDYPPCHRKMERAGIIGDKPY